MDRQDSLAGQVALSPEPAEGSAWRLRRRLGQMARECRCAPERGNLDRAASRFAQADPGMAGERMLLAETRSPVGQRRRSALSGRSTFS